MTVIRKRSGDKGGCCNPYSELQLEIERVDQTAIDAKTIANNAEATINSNMGKINDAIAIAPQVETNTANISQHEDRINTNTTNINKNTIDIQEQDKDITALKTKTVENENRINTNTTNINKNTIDIQKQSEDIVALKTKTNENENRINTNTTNINKNTTDIQKQSEDIVALKTKTNDNSAAIEVLEDEVGPETVAGTIQYRLKNIDTKLPTAIKEVGIVADASTVTHKATHISGTAESDALPVVSRTQAGIISASVYAAMEDVIANNTSRISVLEQSALTYDISGLVSADPTNAEISAAFQQKYPNIPIQPGIRVADYNNAHFWQYGNNMWILLTQINIQTATNDSLGIVKGSNTDGKVFVETDGSMSLKGYDALVSKDATHDSKINTLEVGLGNANARIDATNTNVANNAADIVAANNEIATNTNDINGLKGRMATAEEQIATHDTKITHNTQSINGLSTDVNGLKSRMSTAEGQISTNETNINGLTTDVNGLKTNKQNKLTAGDNITIVNDVISASGKKKIYTGTIESLIDWVPRQKFEIKQEFDIEFIYTNAQGLAHIVRKTISKQKLTYRSTNSGTFAKSMNYTFIDEQNQSDDQSVKFSITESFNNSSNPVLIIKATIRISPSLTIHLENHPNTSYDDHYQINDYQVTTEDCPINQGGVGYKFRLYV